MTCAIWLGKHGFRPVVVEKSPHIRAAGASSAFADASYLCRALINSEPENAFSTLEKTMHTAISDLQPEKLQCGMCHEAGLDK